MSGTLYIVSAPSGAGKTSLVKALVAGDSRLAVSVSHTTRPRRTSERNGADYHFVDARTFERMVAEDAFLEHARVFDNYYGTARAALAAQLEEGFDVILEIDWQGARQMRQKMPASVGVFVLPPSRTELERRLRGRGQDSDSVIERRLRDSIAELSHFGEYDYLVINDNFDSALEDLRAIVRGGRLRCAVQRDRHRDLLAELMD